KIWNLLLGSAVSIAVWMWSMCSPGMAGTAQAPPAPISACARRFLEGREGGDEGVERRGGVVPGVLADVGSALLAKLPTCALRAVDPLDGCGEDVDVSQPEI